MKVSPEYKTGLFAFLATVGVPTLWTPLLSRADLDALDLLAHGVPVPRSDRNRPGAERYPNAGLYALPTPKE